MSKLPPGKPGGFFLAAKHSYSKLSSLYDQGQLACTRHANISEGNYEFNRYNQRFI